MGRRFNLGTDVISNRHARRRAKALAKRNKKKMAKSKLGSFQEMETLEPKVLMSAVSVDANPDDYSAIEDAADIVAPPDLGLLNNDYTETLGIVTAGATLNFDASSESSNDGTWESTVNAGTRDWAMGVNITHDASLTDAPTGITAAYVFPTSGTDAGADKATTATYESAFNENNDATWEFWLRPNDLTNSQVIWETGGGALGSSLTINDGELRFTMKSGTPSETVVSVALPNDNYFHQVVAVYDRDDAASVSNPGAGDTLRLYVDGVLVDTDDDETAMEDWSGGDGAGLGGRGGDTGANGGEAGPLLFNTFDGEIAIFRFYENKALTAAEAAVNFEAVAGERPDVIAVNGDVNGVGSTITLASGAEVTVNADGTFTYDQNSAFDSLVAGAPTTDTFDYTVAADVQMEVATVSGITETATTVNFTQTFESAPVVFVLLGEEDTTGPTILRIDNVTTTGFDLAQLEADASPGTTTAATVTYLAIEEGVHTIGGVTFEVGRTSTTTQQHGAGTFSPSATGWDSISFNGSFSAAPTVVAAVQTRTNSVTTLATAVQSNSVSTSGFNLALERAEDDLGTLNLNETIGWIAVEEGPGSFTLADGTTVLFDAVTTADDIDGWGQEGVDGEKESWTQTFGGTPLAVASQYRRDGGDGGWIRQRFIDSSEIGLVVEEDTVNDTERNHTPEAAGVLAFSQTFSTNSSATATVTITGVNDPATIGGALSDSINEDDTVAGGTATVTDDDTGESEFVPQTSTTGTYGDFSIDAAGVWTYTRTADLNSLAVGESVTDTFSVTSEDGTDSQNVVITINGTNDAPVANDDMNTVDEDGTVTVDVNNYGDVIVNDTPAPTAYWSFNEATTGPNGVADQTANGYDGQLFNGTATVRPGISGDGVTFDNNDDYVALNMSFAAANSIPTMTVSGWFRTSEPLVGGTDSDNNWAILDFDRSEYFNVYVASDDGSIGFSTNASGSSVDDQFTSDGAAVNAVTGLNDGEWHHVAVTYDNGTKSIYVDGVLSIQETGVHGGAALGTGITRFGMIGDGSEATTFNGNRNEFYFNGDLDEIGYWNTDLDAGQVKELFTSAGLLANDTYPDFTTPDPVGVSSVAVTLPALAYNAANPGGTPATDWADTTGVTGFDMALDVSVSVVANPVTEFTGITRTYSFNGNGGGTMDSLENFVPDPTQSSASFEVWFNPDDLTDGDTLFETGGTTDGMTLSLQNSLVQFEARDGGAGGSQSITATTAVNTGEFHQAVGVIEFLGGGGANLHLYLDGQLQGTINNATMVDWAGASGSGTGTGDGAPSIGSGAGGDFEGDIAIVNFYTEAISASQVASNYAAVTTGPTLNFDAENETIGSGDNVWNSEPNVATHTVNFSAGFTSGDIALETVSSSLAGINQAYSFNGNAGASVTTLQNLPGNPTDASATWEMWFRPDSGQTGVQYLYDTGGSGDGMAIQYDTDTGDVIFTVDNGGTQRQVIGGAGLINSSEFHKLTAVYAKDFSGNSDEVRLYIDGRLVDDSSVLPTTTLNDWAGTDGGGVAVLGGTIADTAPAASNFVGDIAKFRFYETDLSLADVQQNYMAVAGRPFVISHIDPSNGTVTVGADGSYKYTHDGSETTSDSFTYTIIDDQFATDTATVNITITPVNDNAPVFTSAASANLDENTTAVATVTATDDDLPAQTVTFSIDGSGADDGKFAITAGGDLSFNIAPDFESPNDLGGTAGDNIYEVKVKADDGNDVIIVVNSDAVAVDDSYDAEVFTLLVTSDEDLAIPSVIGRDNIGDSLDGDLNNDSVLVNDVDPDATDVLEVLSADGNALSGSPGTGDGAVTFVTGLGATVTMNDDGTFTYNATTSGTLLALPEGMTMDDSFTYTMTDGNGGTSSATVTVTVTGAEENSVHIIDCPCGEGGKAIIVRGSVGDDKIDVKLGSMGDTIKIKIKAGSLHGSMGTMGSMGSLGGSMGSMGSMAGTMGSGGHGSFKFEVANPHDGVAINKVIVYGLDGNDDLKVKSDLDINGWLFGGNGDDRLKGGKGDDVISGGTGDDKMDGKSGTDFMIGGTGADKIKGQKGEDLLIAGSLTDDYANNLAAFCAIMSEWTRTDVGSTFESRVKNVFDGDGGINAGNNEAYTLLNHVILSDGAKDTLKGGGSGVDWFIYTDPS